MKALKYLTILLVLAIAQTSTAQKPALDRVDSLLDRQATEFRFSGVVLIASHGQVLLHRGYGWKDYGTRQPIDTLATFQVGSLTKQFTAAIIFKLIGQGRIGYNDPLDKFLPDFPNAGQMTIAHLLTHSAGLYNYTQQLSPLKFITRKTIGKEAVLKLFRERPLAFRPGTDFAYTNSGYFLLGMVIEKITGQPYEKVVRDSIFAPLGMASSGFDFRNLQDPHKPTGYSVYYRERQSEAAIMDSTALYSAGGIFSSTRDLLRWSMSLYHANLLGTSSTQSLLTPYRNGYANGVGTGTMFSKPYFSHSGQTSNYSAQLLYFPQDDLQIILLSNVVADQWNRTAAIAQLLHGQQQPWGNTVYPSPGTEKLQSYCGTYRHQTGAQLTISIEGGKLAMNGSRGIGIDKSILVPVSLDTFYYLPARMEVRFSGTGGSFEIMTTRDGMGNRWIRD